MKKWVGVAAMLTLVLTGCSSDEEGHSVAPSNSEASLLPDLPRCDDVWVIGDKLPEAYRGCIDRANEVVPSSVMNCGYDEEWGDQYLYWHEDGPLRYVAWSADEHDYPSEWEVEDGNEIGRANNQSVYDTAIAVCREDEGGDDPGNEAAAADPVGPLSHDAVVRYVQRNGFPSLQQDREMNRSIKDSCDVIDGVRPGTWAMRQDRQLWLDAIVDDDTTKERGNGFVDVLFEGCYETGKSRRWTPPPPKTSFGDGTWRVGTDVAAGQYRVAAADDYCVWYRLNKMSSGTDAGAIIEWGWADAGTPALTTISPSDAAFQSIGCGTWRNIG